MILTGEEGLAEKLGCHKTDNELKHLLRGNLRLKCRLEEKLRKRLHKKNNNDMINICYKPSAC